MTSVGVVPELVGSLEITIGSGSGVAGSTVIVPAQVTNAGSEPVQVVLLIQGLAPAWCPPPQVVLLPGGNTADVFLHLRPPPGTPAGRYLWALTVQTAHHPMQAVTTELVVHRDPPPVSTPPGRRRRPVVVAVGLLALATAATLVAVLAHRPSAPESLPRRVSPVRPTATPTPVVGSSAEPVALAGTVLAGEVGRVRVSVVRFTLDDLSDLGRASGTPVKATVRVKGKQWTTTLPPGIYGMTFRQKGFQPSSIVVDTTVMGWAPPPWVQLSPVSGQNGDQQGAQQQGGDDR